MPADDPAVVEPPPRALLLSRIIAQTAPVDPAAVAPNRPDRLAPAASTEASGDLAGVVGLEIVVEDLPGEASASRRFGPATGPDVRPGPPPASVRPVRQPASAEAFRALLGATRHDPADTAGEPQVPGAGPVEDHWDDGGAALLASLGGRSPAGGSQAEPPARWCPRCRMLLRLVVVLLTVALLTLLVS